MITTIVTLFLFALNSAIWFYLGKYSVENSSTEEENNSSGE